MNVSLTNLPLSKLIVNSTPATVILVAYCKLPKSVMFCMVDTEPRRLREAGEGPDRACRGRRTALADESRMVRKKESGIRERIEGMRRGAGTAFSISMFSHVVTGHVRGYHEH